MTPDGEALVVSYLLDALELAPLVGNRIGTKTPKTTDEPWIKVTQIDDNPSPISSALHLTTVHLQLDCYGSDDREEAVEEASDIVRTARMWLHAMPAADFSDAVVSKVWFGPMSHIPDPSLNPARERFVLDAFVTCHSVEVAS